VISVSDYNKNNPKSLKICTNFLVLYGDYFDINSKEVLQNQKTSKN